MALVLQTFSNFLCPDRSATRYSTRFSAVDVSDEDFEEVESSCSSVKKVIRPTKLNNIYGIPTKIVNIDTYNQTLAIQECV